jgi:SAM-dependent methyltransferase
MNRAERAKEAIRPGYLRLRQTAAWAQFHLGIRDSEAKIERDAQRFWDSNSRHLPQLAHWRGAGVFADDARWLAWGKGHLDLYRDFARMLDVPTSVQRIVEWGSGGGANAIHFAPFAREYVGVEITQANLNESVRMLAGAGIRNFAPVLIRTDAPEKARTLISGPCEVFLCVGVFQALPTPEYGYRVLEIAYDLMAPGGLAMIQIKYIKKSWATKPKRFGYKRNYPILTSYDLDEFWVSAEQMGFEPKCLTLVPRHPVNGDGDYAYFLLRKPTGDRQE